MHRSTGEIQNLIGGGLDSTVPILGKILILVVRFAVPALNTESTEDLMDTVTHFGLRTIADMLSMAPRSRMLSSRVLTNSLSAFKP